MMSHLQVVGETSDGETVLYRFVQHPVQYSKWRALQRPLVSDQQLAELEKDDFSFEILCI